MGTPGGAGFGDAAAFFDVDGTLADTNVLLAYAFFRLRGRSRLYRWQWLARFYPRVLHYIYLDRRSRQRFLEAYARLYAGVRREHLDAWAWQVSVPRYWRPRVFSQALKQVEHHRAQGHLVVVLSGGLEATVKPLASWLQADAVIGARMEEQEGRFTGRLLQPAPINDGKALAARQLAEERGLDIAACYAYADDDSDRDLLEEVGHPVVVNPRRGLRRLAQERGWPVYHWTH